MPTDDTIRDAPGPDAKPRGKALVWVMLVLAGFAALGTVMSVVTGGVPTAAEAQRQFPSQNSPVDASQRAEVIKQVVDLSRSYAPWLVVAGVPYALATLAMFGFGIAVVSRDRDSLRRGLMVAALAAAVTRVGVGLVIYNITEDEVALVGKIMESSPRGPPHGDDRTMKRAVSITDDIATTMSMVTTVGVALFWLITGLAVAPRREEEPSAAPAT